MTLSVSIDHRLGDFHLRAEFACEGRLTALFGASGSGKTSVVNAIAGLLNPDSARIVVDGVTLVDTQTGVRLPTHRREIGYVFQEARLFPHMNVRQNLLYAQWFGGRGSRPGVSFDAVVDMLGVGDLLRRHPSRLSGGEKQRVAIGRALLSHPRLLLMDEPLASLDDARKLEILPFIERLRDEAKVPIVYVSHALGEVRRLADFVVMMERGVVVESGDPQAVFRDASAAATEPLHVLDVLSCEGSALGGFVVKTCVGAFQFDAPPRSQRFAISDRDIVISLDAPSRTSAPAVLQGAVEAIDSSSGQTRLTLRVHDKRFMVMTPESFIRASGLREGSGVHLIVTRVQPA